MKISIVIPTYNRAKLLADTLPALASQKLADGVDYEVLFVSNGSTDHTEAVMRDAMARWPGRFRYWRIEPTGGPSAPRNHGIRAAEGDVIVILDDDVLPQSDLVMAYADFHRRHPGLADAAIGEAYVPEHLLSDPMSKFHIFPYDELRTLPRLNYLHFWTCNVSLKREFMLRHGMFDEQFLYYEDILCGYKLEQAGLHLRFWPAARGQHLHQMTAAGLPAKGRFLGRWVQPLLERIPDSMAAARLGVLTPELPLRLYVRRAAGRLVFRTVDNRLTAAMLEALGARGSTRNAITDWYYGLIFRRNLLDGYEEARRQAAEGRPMALAVPNSSLADRGDH